MEATATVPLKYLKELEDFKEKMESQKDEYVLIYTSYNNAQSRIITKDEVIRQTAKKYNELNERFNVRCDEIVKLNAENYRTRDSFEKKLKKFPRLAKWIFGIIV